MLQEIWGVNAHIRAVAEQYASDGYVVLAPDLFWRMQPRVDLGYDEAGTQQAFGYRKGIDLALADRDIRSTVDVLRGMGTVAGGVAASATAWAACSPIAPRPGPASTARSATTAAASRSSSISPRRSPCRWRFHFGGKDTHITPDQVAAIEATLGDRDDVRIDTYADADHGFNCWARPSYHQNARRLSRTAGRWPSCRPTCRLGAR